MQSGYIKLWRKLEHSPIFTNSEAVHLFVYLLIKANRIEREKIHGNTKIKLLPGQLITGRKALAEATGINESKVYRTLELLKSEQQIEQQTNSKYSIITICNWQSYQQSEQQIEQPVNNKRTASEQQVNTDKKEENLKTVENEKKESKSSRFTPPDWIDLVCWNAFIEMRAKIKKPLTEKAMEMAVEKLDKLRREGEDVAAVLNQSTFSSWQGLFPVKDDGNKANKTLAGRLMATKHTQDEATSHVY